MTNFFLEELRKIYGDGRVIHDPQFVGECCYGSLGDLRVKARFTKDIVANQYPYLTVSILNPTKGVITKKEGRYYHDKFLSGRTEKDLWRWARDP